MTLKTRKHFTLVELLVVIAIITVLASLLAPVARKSYDAARQTACVNNLRNLYLRGIIAYGNDFRNFIPSPENHSGSYLSRYLGSDYFGYSFNLSTQSGGTNWGRAKSTIFICPADKTPLEASTSLQMIPLSYLAYCYSGTGGNHSQISKRTSQIRRPSSAGYITDCSVSPSRGWFSNTHLTFPHGQGFLSSMLWLDGKVTAVNLIETIGTQQSTNFLSSGWYQ